MDSCYLIKFGLHFLSSLVWFSWSRMQKDKNASSAFYDHFQATVNGKLFFHIVTRLKHWSLSRQTVAY